jgi:anti-sigma B factor antagonist
MNLRINQREREGVIILDLDGPLSLDETGLRQSLDLLHQHGKVNIALNLQNVSRIDSTGLGTLVFALVKLRKAGGRLALFNLNSAHLDLLLLTKLVTVFELFADEQGAVDSNFPDRAANRYDILNFVQREDEAGQPLGDVPAGLPAMPPATATGVHLLNRDKEL